MTDTTVSSSDSERLKAEHSDVASNGDPNGPSRYVPEEPESGIVWSRFGILLGIFGALLVLGGINTVLFAFAIIAVLVIHEWGHFSVARWSGMKVTEYFVGFGPRIFSWTRGETSYGLKAIPAGAYVRIVGMNNLEDVDPVDEPRTYRQAPWHKRVLTILAGPATHFVIAFGLMVLLLSRQGVALPEDEVWAVDQVSLNSAAESAGLEEGDRIISVDGVDTPAFEALADVIPEVKGEEVELVLERNGETVVTEARIGERLTASGARGINGLYIGERIVGFEGTPVSNYAEFVALVNERIADVESSGQELGLVEVDLIAATSNSVRTEEVEIRDLLADGESRIVEVFVSERLSADGQSLGQIPAGYANQVLTVDGEEVPVVLDEDRREVRADGFFSLASDLVGEEVTVQIRNGDEVVTEVITIDGFRTEEATNGFLGVRAGIAFEDVGTGEAIVEAPQAIGGFISEIASRTPRLVTTRDGLRSLFGLTAFDEPPNSVVTTLGAEQRPLDTNFDENRPISLIGIIAIAADLGLNEILLLLVILNLFFGLFNLLPLLPLDGGHIVLATYERIRSIGKKTAYRADAAKLLPVTYMIVGLMLFVSVIAMVRDVFDFVI